MSNKRRLYICNGMDVCGIGSGRCYIHGGPCWHTLNPDCRLTNDKAKTNTTFIQTNTPFVFNAYGNTQDKRSRNRKLEIEVSNER